MTSATSTFGIRTSGVLPSFVVLDKSFLDAAGSAQLQYYASKGWTFGVPEALIYELVRKRDEGRARSFLKLSRIQENLVRLPGIGEIFRAEKQQSKPASSILKAKRVRMLATGSLSSEPFPIRESERRATNERTAMLKGQLPKLIKIWRALGELPELRDVSRTEMLKKLEALRKEIRGRAAVRQFYERQRHPSYPVAELLDERWALFRWVQVILIAGLDFFGSYGLKAEPNQEKLLHEVIDLDYTISALLVGGLACCEKHILRRFKLLRPDGVLLSL